MLRLLVAGFLIAHGLVHPAIYAPPQQAGQADRFDPGHSWVLAAAHVGTSPAHALSVAVAWVTAVAFALAGAILLAGGSWWLPAAAAAVIGLVLKVGYFNPWLSFGVLLDLGVLAAAVMGWPASLA